MSENNDEEDIWQDSNDHRTVFFVNRSREWVELKGTLKLGENREMTSTARIPPKATYVHLFLGNFPRSATQTKLTQKLMSRVNA